MTDTQTVNQQSALKKLVPNLFEFQGYHTHISSSTSSIMEVPQLSYSALLLQGSGLD